MSSQTLAEPLAAPYVSSFQKYLSRGRWFAIGLTLLWALACYGALHAIAVETRVVGRDTAPSISAAEKIRSLLADANGNLANVLLTGEDATGPNAKAMRDDIQRAERALVEASENITYGDEEKTPITTIMVNLAEYESLAGAAQAWGRDARSLAKAITADSLMRATILPATEALDRVNDNHLTELYAFFQNAKLARLAEIVVMSGIAAALLGALQYLCFRNAHRILNPGLGAATLIVLATSIYCIAVSAAAESELRTAKSDAFDSIYALSSLEAIANDANAAESYWLLSYDDAAARQKYADLFQELTQKIVAGDVDRALKDAAANLRLTGYLGDELANITFAGEEAAAKATLNTWADYVHIDAKIRALQDSGQRAQALALDTGRQPGQSNWAFDHFQSATEKTIEINQRAFDDAIARSESHINSVVYGAIAFAGVLACLATWFGIQQRLREYEF